MSPKRIASVIASSSLLLAVFLSAGSDARGQAASKTKAAAKAKIDLNKATAEELEEHLPGVGAVTAKKIVDGRPYTAVDDLAKAGVPQRTIDGIRGLVTVGAPPAAAKPAAKTAAKPAAKPAAPGHVNLNTATAEELETLPGIGPVHAKEIIANRPYKSVDDLERVKGLGKARIDEIRSRVTATMPAPAAAPATTSTTTTKPAAGKPAAKAAARLAPGKKVNINTASKDELDVLPGIGPVKAQAIIEGRPFKAIDDIKKVKGIKDGEFGKIKDMITVD